MAGGAPPGPGPRRLGRSLDELASSLGAPPARTLAAVFGAWSEIVGEAVAAHARPGRLRDRTLLVHVDDPIWATQLRFLEADLLGRLAAVAGEEIERIHVVVRR
jgi:predicted nucleic acid-binding Zn ribbon protein